MDKKEIYKKREDKMQVRDFPSYREGDMICGISRGVKISYDGMVVAVDGMTSQHKCKEYAVKLLHEVIDYEENRLKEKQEQYELQKRLQKKVDDWENKNKLKKQ